MAVDAVGSDDTGPVQLRCGVARPTGLAPDVGAQVVDPVQVVLPRHRTIAAPSGWPSIIRPYEALWLPVNVGNGPITDVSSSSTGCCPAPRSTWVIIRLVLR